MLNCLTHILLIDNNRFTSLLMLRLFAYLGCTVRHVNKIALVEQLGNEKPFEIVLINLACSCKEERTISQCLRCLQQEVSVISYTPEVLMNDFKQAALSAHMKLVDDAWMLHTKLFQFLTSLEI
ncbi:MAG: hypothetical protein QM652_09175 [Legionella sp.]|uniref:hypothetical protein n=1 Tax=Legionella sp. TaxID=459 RepID=UPI0039E465BB